MNQDNMTKYWAKIPNAPIKSLVAFFPRILGPEKPKYFYTNPLHTKA